MSDYNLKQCNPSTLKSTHTTCLPAEMIIRLRDAWNKRFPDHAIPTTIRKKEEIWVALRSRMLNQYKCNSEYCAVQKLESPTVAAATATFFRPEKPAEWAKTKDPEEKWHDTASIARVMEQYEAAYPHFDFIGPVPIDFDAILPGNWGRCIVDELCGLDLRTARKKGKKAIGVVFNLDPHDKPGSHWVCAYVDIEACKAYYYDSYGMEPCPEIRRFLRRCRDQGCHEIQWNDIRHQRKKTECGTYCMFVIISLLKGRQFAEICRDRIDDDLMYTLRDVLYATVNPTPRAIQEAIKLI